MKTHLVLLRARDGDLYSPQTVHSYTWPDVLRDIWTGQHEDVECILWVDTQHGVSENVTQRAAHELSRRTFAKEQNPPSQVALLCASYDLPVYDEDRAAARDREFVAQHRLTPRDVGIGQWRGAI